MLHPKKLSNLTVFCWAMVMPFVSTFTYAKNTTTSEKAGFENTGSVYTSIRPNACQVIAKNPEEESYEKMRCPSLGNYQVFVDSRDLRIDLTLGFGKKLVTYQPVPYHHLGNNIEWRYHQQGGQKIYHALIYRLYTPKLNETGKLLPQSQDIQELIVIRLDKEKSCLLGSVPSSTTMNEQARKLADNPNQPCKSFE